MDYNSPYIRDKKEILNELAWPNFKA